MGSTRPSPAGDYGPEPQAPATVTDQAQQVPHSQQQIQDHGEEQPQPHPQPTTQIQQVRRLRLVGTGGVVSRAREFARGALHDWGWLPSTTEGARAAAEDVLLVVSELVTNACLHAGGPEELRVGRGTKLLRVEVQDRGEGVPALRTTRRVGRPGGHGMFIVQRLCLDWGVVQEAGATGKTVWAELAAPTLD